MGRLSSTAAIGFLICVALAGAAVPAADVVTTTRDQDGWRLLVNGQDYYVKGVVWGYSPRGENYAYDLWGEPDDLVRAVLDYEFTLMKTAGINAIRSFALIPPRWVSYVYREYGIMTIINPLMGRYGATIDGHWVPVVDYADPVTRRTLKAEALEIVSEYQNVPGVLMFALGNESNYGLSWSGFEIQDLPEGEQHAEQARYLYSLFNETIRDGKTIAPDVPFTIVNGDIQYIDLIEELMPDLDLLGVNAYRGPGFTSLWKVVDEKLDLPVVLFEFGSDAFDALEGREDQLAQARLLKSQWQEMYNNAWGNSEEGNSIGGFVFEWRDEWWKYLQDENLDVHDTHASWSNQGYLFDWAEGRNNMNEEWFGITALGRRNADGVYTARPRAAYYVLSEIWALDPYECNKAARNEIIDGIDVKRREPGSATTAKPVPVELRKSAAGWQLLRGGEPYLIRGAGGSASLERLAEAGANSIRTWSTDRAGEVLDEAHRLGMTVTVGIWLAHERHGFDYRDPQQVASQMQKARAAVLAYRDHPALLMWGIGNEAEGLGEGGDPVIWTAINDIAAMVKELDPYHPTMTSTAELGGKRIEFVHERSPAIDVHGINTYGGALSIADRLRDGGGTKPYVLTEFGPVGPWEMPTTDWGAPYEQTSTQKADFYRQSFRNAVLESGGQALGAYAFLWGHKMESTATWFGMLLDDGARLGAVDAMTELWTGTAPEDRSPTIEPLVIDTNPQLDPGSTFTVSTRVSDPDGDRVRIRWVLRPEADNHETGGDFQEALPDVENAVVESSGATARIRMPRQSGPYRLFAYAYDAAGNAATANIPLFVKSGSRR